MPRFLVIDEDGFPSLDGGRIDDPEVGSHLLKNLRRAEHDRFVTLWDDTEVIVEAFDEPLVVRHVERANGRIQLILPYDLRMQFSPESLCLDEWDRFHGVTEDKLPFVFSRQAQFEFFDLVDSFDDESVTIDGRRVPVPPFYIVDSKVNQSEFWNHIYQTETPGWEVGHEAKALPDVLPQLKISRAKVLVLGCGSGQDAAYFAKQGHLVTAVDFSTEAIQRAKANFEGQPGLKFEQSDIFEFRPQGRFDLIFEHACYAAVSPNRREDLISLWRKWLVPNGHLLGVFFMMSKRSGPPFGNSEWELRQRLRDGFRFLYWTRWRHSIERRMGRELVVYAQLSK